MKAGCEVPYLSHIDRPSRETTTILTRLYSTFFTSSAENLAAFCLLTISSSFGCFHVPVVGVDGVDCATGVEGRTGVNIAKRIGMRRPGLLQNYEAVSLKHVDECQQRGIEVNSPPSRSVLAAV
jgi:hypothetical protein